MKNKLIYVRGEDYAAIFFEDWVRNNQLSFEEACKLTEIEDDEGYANIIVKEFGEIDSEFIKFMYTIQDDDFSKHENFYFENNEIFKHEK